MIVIDSSALIAILLIEPEAEIFGRTMGLAEQRVIGAPTAFETLMVARGKLENRIDSDLEVRTLLARSKVEVVPWSPALTDIAQAAFLRFGKGRHPAKLNFGDCISYALAKSLDCPLLYKGDDFAQTDIVSALASP